MPVDPTKPATFYTGHDRQEWQRLQPKPAPAPKTTPPRTSPAPSYPTVRYPVTVRDPVPASPRHSPGSSPPSHARPPVFHNPAIGVGSNEALTQKFSEIAAETVGHVWPLKAATELGERIAGARPKVRIWLAVLCAVAAAGIAAVAGWTGLVLLLALAGGGAVGWALPTVLGLLLAFTAQLTGLVIGILWRLLVLALLIVAIFFLVRLMS